ncbi:MAG: TapB family protein [Streptosporangiaceae bacterium]
MGVGASSSTSTGATAADASDAPGSGANGGTSSVTSNSIVAPASIPFPVAVGDTWVYQSTTAIDGTNSLTTNKIVSAVPTAGGYQVTMYQTTGLAGSVTTVRQVYIFYPDGTIGYPVTGANGVSVTGSSGVRWPDAAGLAAGRVYHSVLPVRVSQAGGSYTNADVTVQSAGTATVTVPAGTYRATVVDMTITTKVGRFSTTTEVETWLTPGTGPVKSEVLVHAGGNTKLITTNRLLSFTRGAVRADGS